MWTISQNDAKRVLHTKVFPWGWPLRNTSFQLMTLVLSGRGSDRLQACDLQINWMSSTDTLKIETTVLTPSPATHSPISPTHQPQLSRTLGLSTSPLGCPPFSTIVAPFTLLLHAEILRQFSASSSVRKFQIQRGVKFHSGAKPPLEVVSGPYYWQTEPVWTDKLAMWSGGVSIVQSVNCTGPSLNLKVPYYTCFHQFHTAVRGPTALYSIYIVPNPSLVLNFSCLKVALQSSI